VLRLDTVQSQNDGPRILDVENFKDIASEGEMSKDAPMPAFYDSEMLPVLSPSLSELPVLSSSPSALPELSSPSLALPELSSPSSALPELSSPSSALPELSSSSSALPVLWPSSSALPVLWPSTSALAVLSSSSSALPDLWPPTPAFPVLSPSPSPGPAVESLLQPWCVEGGGFISVESVAKEQSYFFPVLHPSVDSWKQDCKSNSSAFLGTTIINNTSLVIRASLAGSPIDRSLPSCSHRSCNDESDRVGNLPPHSQQDATLLYGGDEVERNPGILSYSLDQPTDRRIVQERTADWHQCGVCWKRFRRKPDCNRHEKFTCGSDDFGCIVCKKDLCRKDSLMRHLTRNAGRNPCSMVLEAAQISNSAVASRRASRKDLGTDREIEAALKRYEGLPR